MIAIIPKELVFLAALPGRPSLTKFRLHPIDGADGLFALQSSEAPGWRIFVVNAAVYIPNYEPVISSTDAAALDLTDAADALVRVVANPADEGTSINLLAPIVVNRTTGSANQVILEGQEWPLHAELKARSA